MKKRMFLIDVKNDSVAPVMIESENALEQYYKLLDCEIIDIAERKIGDKYYDIICDDEGLLKGDAIPSAINKDKEPMLVGNLLICNLADEEGEEVGLEPEDLVNITEHLASGVCEIEGSMKHFPVVVCEY